MSDRRDIPGNAIPGCHFMNLKVSFLVLLVVGFYSFASPRFQITIQSTTEDDNMITRTTPIIYDALIVGGGPAGLSTALALARVCRTSMLFDSGEYRNNGTEAMHTFLSRDGIHPEEFRATARQQIKDKYSAQVSFMKSRIVRISNTEILPGYKGFEAVDSSNQTFVGRKLVLATGTEDLLPTDIEGYKENWPAHM
jgi:gliotoxin/aspirochlorine biosynthesis thioredoxin reductase